jgi:MinD superfamily P-loop ATPase
MSKPSKLTVELVVISGKGGTGKTSLVASLATLARPVVLADCDVDAADLHLVLEPTIKERHSFVGGNKARIKPGHCVACGKCEELCRFDAIYFDGPGNGRVTKTYRIDPLACEGCGVCAYFCAENAIEYGPVEGGQWFVSQTRCGPMVHARLDPAAGNSGKLVTQLRQKAKDLAARIGGLILCDGSPGLGCPVIASVTGADLVLIVTEPTCSGLHDLERVFQLCRHFNLQTAVCINKWEINESVTSQIEARAAEWGLPVAGRVRYDPNVSEAQIQKQAIVEYDPAAGISEDVRHLWEFLDLRLPQERPSEQEPAAIESADSHAYEI